MKSKFFLILSICAIAVLNNSPAAAYENGQISARQCPHSCRTLGIKKSQCRDWRRGNICYVEDLRRKSTNKYSKRPPIVYKRGPFSPYLQKKSPYTYYNNQNRCNSNYAHYVSSPYVHIDSIKKTGNFFKSKYRVKGSIEGACLTQAALYEHGRFKQEIPVRFSQNHNYYNFELVVDGNRNPEIRAYNSAGRYSNYHIQHTIYNDDRYYNNYQHHDHDCNKHHPHYWRSNATVFNRNR